MDAQIEILRPDGSSERHRIDGERITIGRSPAAGISLPALDALEPEHLLIVPRTDGCWLAVAKDATVPVYVQGRAFDNGTVPWGTEFVIDHLTFRVFDAHAESKKKEPAVSPVFLIAVVLIPLATWLLFRDNSEHLQTTSSEAPKLFADTAACPEQGTAAMTRARNEGDAAWAKSDRYVFAASDGVEAVDRFALAAACYRAAGDDADAKRMEAEHASLAAHIDEDYRSHRLRLDRALRDSLFQEALMEVHALRALTKSSHSPYTEWLLQLQHKLEVKLDAMAKGTPS